VNKEIYYIILYYIILYYIILYYIILYYIILYYIILYYIILYYIILYYISYHISYHIISYIISYHIIYHIIPYHIISYHTIYHIKYVWTSQPFATSRRLRHSFVPAGNQIVNPRSGTSYPFTVMTELLLPASADLTDTSKDIKCTPSSCQYAGTHGYLRHYDTAVDYSVAIPILINKVYISFDIQLAMFKICKSVHHNTIQINKPTRCNNFSSLLLDVYVQLDVFRAFSRPSSGAQQLQ